MTANRSLVADIPYKLSLLAYELSSGPGLDPRDLKFTPEQIELLAENEHLRWMMERERMDWTHGSPRDDSRKRQPVWSPGSAYPNRKERKTAS